MSQKQTINSEEGLFCKKYIAIKAMGCYPFMHNIVPELQYCNPMGLNQAVPPEGLHVILIGYFLYLIQGFSQSHKVKGITIAVRAKEEKETHFLFKGCCPDQAEGNWSSIISSISHPDLSTTKSSTYLINLESGDSSSQKKKGHEMRGVLLMILFYPVLLDNANKFA